MVHQKVRPAAALWLLLSACEPEVSALCRGNTEDQCRAESDLDRCFWLQHPDGEGGCAAVCESSADCEEGEECVLTGCKSYGLETVICMRDLCVMP